MLKEATPQAIYLKDYQVPNFHFHSVELDFDLFEDHTIVTGVMQFSRSPDASKSSPLVLNQAVCERLSIKIDGKEVEASRITEKEEDLLISDVPDRFELTVVSKIKPHEIRPAKDFISQAIFIVPKMSQRGCGEFSLFLIALI